MIGNKTLDEISRKIGRSPLKRLNSIIEEQKEIIKNMRLNHSKVIKKLKDKYKADINELRESLLLEYRVILQTCGVDLDHNTFKDNIKTKRSEALRGAYRRGQYVYNAVIGHKGSILHLGTYDTEVEAAMAYDAKAIELYGDKARLNFINNGDYH